MCLRGRIGDMGGIVIRRNGKIIPRTPKQKKWAKAYIETGSAITASRVAYPTATPTTQETIAQQNAKKLDIVGIFDIAGLTDERIASTINKALDATKQGEPDWLPRLKASEMALKVRGHFKERIEHMGSVGVYPILGGLSKGKDATVIEGETVDK